MTISRRILFLLIAGSISASPTVARPQTTGTARQTSPSASRLIAGLQSPDVLHRDHAAHAAMWTKPLPLAVVPVLLKCFKDPGPYANALNLKGNERRDRENYRRNLVTALSNAGPKAIPLLTRALDDPDAAVRDGAADTLALVARDSHDARLLIDALGNAHDDVRSRVEGAIPYADGARSVPLLVPRLDDRNLTARGGAAVALAYALGAGAPRDSKGALDEKGAWKNWDGPPPNEVILDLARALNGIDPDSRLKTINALAGLAPFTNVAIPYVVPMLKDPDPSQRGAAVKFLEAAGPAANLAIPALIQSIADSDPETRLWAIRVLGRLGPAAKAAVPDLDTAMNGPDKDTAGQAAIALANIAPDHKGLFAALMRAFNDICQSDPETACTSSATTDPDDLFRAFGELGAFAGPAAPALEHVLAADKQDSDRQAAATALAKIEGAAAIPTLQRVMRSDSEDSVRTTAAAALGPLASTNTDAVAVLIGAFSNDSQAVRDAASDALIKAGANAVPALIEALKSPDLYTRAWSTQTLSAIKPMPDDASHALTVALKDKSAVVTAEATAALKGEAVKAQDAIKDQQLQGETETDNDPGLASFIAGNASEDPHIYNRDEIVASIPPGPNDEYPHQLKYLVPFGPARDSSTADAEFLATVHTENEGRDRLAVWKKIGNDKYRRLFVEDASDSQYSYEQPKVFSSKVFVTGQGNDHFEPALFIDFPLDVAWGDGGGVDDTVFALDHAELHPVEIPRANENSTQLRDGEWTWNSLSNSFSDDSLQFSFGIWKPQQCHVCGTAKVDGTYRAVKQMHYDPQKKDWVANWKMLVDTAMRTPP